MEWRRRRIGTHVFKLALLRWRRRVHRGSGHPTLTACMSSTPGSVISPTLVSETLVPRNEALKQCADSMPAVCGPSLANQGHRPD